MSEAILGSKLKCRNCKARIASVQLQPAKQTIKLNPEPHPDGELGLIREGLPGDKKTPPVVVFLDRSRRPSFGGKRYKQHVCT